MGKDHATSRRRRGRVLRTRRAALLVATAVALVSAACAPTPPGGSGGGPTTTSTTIPLGDEPFTVIVIGDSEARMRGNTNEEISTYVADLIALRGERAEYFARDGGVHRIDPELVVLAGDISLDRGTSIDADMPLWAPLYDNGIAFVAAAGNHDWEPVTFSDGSAGYSVSGHLSNESTKAFVLESHVRSAALTDRFRYRSVGPASAHGPEHYVANYRGVDIVNFNTFLYQPSYRYPDGWPLSCNLLAGGAGCQQFVSAESQIERTEALLDDSGARTALFVQHYPITTPSNWWGDSDASGLTTSQKQQRLLGLMDRYEHAQLFAGHNHSPLIGRQHSFAGRTFLENVTPFFGGANADDLTLGGGALAVLVSPTQGVLEVRLLP